MAIANNCKAIIDFVNSNNYPAAQQTLTDTKALFTQSSALLTTLTLEADKLQPGEQLIATRTDLVINSAPLIALEEMLENSKKNGEEIDPSILEEIQSEKELINPLQCAANEMGAISTTIKHSQTLWQMINNKTRFVAELTSVQNLIKSEKKPQLITTQVSGISSRWLELVRVTQLVSQSIAGVLSSLNDPMPSLESKQPPTPESQENV